MLTFRVAGMSCGHCVASVTGAVREAVPSGPATVDLASGVVRVSDDADPAAVVRAIAAAGYDATQVAA